MFCKVISTAMAQAAAILVPTAATHVRVTLGGSPYTEALILQLSFIPRRYILRILWKLL